MTYDVEIPSIGWYFCFVFVSVDKVVCCNTIANFPYSHSEMILQKLKKLSKSKLL
jgi:hypothetical protein